MAKKSKDLQYYEAVGRRKTSVARVRLYIAGKDKAASVKGKKYTAGQFIVNGKLATEVFPSPFETKRYSHPFELTNTQDRFIVSVVTKGGGKNGQLEAIIHGISRALLIAETESRPVLKQNGLLTRDPRARERRMVGTGGKSRKQKQSPKR